MLSFRRSVLATVLSLFLSVGALYAPWLFARTSPQDDCGQTFSSPSDPVAVEGRALAQFVERGRIEQHLRKLTGLDPIYNYKLPGRGTPPDREIARMYVMSYLESLGVKVYLEKFDRGINIIGVIPGRKTPRNVFEISAHIDTNGATTPGADDNGSGLVTVLEAARIFSANPPDSTLYLSILDLEEVGMDGSKHHAKLLNQYLLEHPEVEFLGALVADMYGYNPPDNHRVVLEVGTEETYGRGGGGSFRSFDEDRPSWRSDSRDSSPKPKGNRYTPAEAYARTMTCAGAACYQFLRFAQQNARGPHNLKLSLDFETAKPGTGDHGSYWAKQLPAMFLAAPYEYPYIHPGNHSSGDDMTQINWPYLESVVQFAVEVTFAMVGGGIAPHTQEAEFLRTFMREEENTSIARTDDLPGQLRTVPPPPRMFSYRSDDSSSSSFNASTKDEAAELIEKLVKEGATLLLIAEKSGERGDLGYLKNGELKSRYFSIPSEFAQAVAAAKAHNLIILQKNEINVVTHGNINDAVYWLYQYKFNATLKEPLPSSAPEGFSRHEYEASQPKAKIENEKKPASEAKSDEPKKGRKKKAVKAPGSPGSLERSDDGESENSITKLIDDEIHLL